MMIFRYFISHTMEYISIRKKTWYFWYFHNQRDRRQPRRLAAVIL